MPGKFVIFACYWNDMYWLEASLEHLLYWEPDEIYLAEGCWDSKYPERSTDGTRKHLEEWAKGRDNTFIIDNKQTHKYRENQAETCNAVLQTSELKAGDWIMYHASDVFYFKYDIDRYKRYMNIGSFDYPIYSIWNFWDSITEYYPHRTKQAPNLPQKVIKGAKFVPTCQLTIGGKLYYQSNQARGMKVPTIQFHYEGLREEERLRQKYGVGDRQSPVTWKNGIKLKKRTKYTGGHPEFAIPVLKQRCFYEEI